MEDKERNLTLNIGIVLLILGIILFIPTFIFIHLEDKEDITILLGLAANINFFLGLFLMAFGGLNNKE